MTTGIYKITNLVNGKVYIGASKNIESRWSNHKRCAGSPIHSDLEAYGLENFKFEVLLECPETMLAQWERDMICLYDSDDPEKGYNDKGDRPYNLKVSETLKGHIVSEEVKRKISEAHRGIPLSEEHKRKLSESHKGKSRTPHSDETRRKISEANKGKIRSEETRRRISKTHKGIPCPEESKSKRSEKMKEYWRKKKEV